MSAPRLHSSPPRKLAPLPPMDETTIPAWRITRHAVALTMGAFVLLAGLVVAGASLVTMRVTVDGDGVLEPVSVWPVRSIESGVLSDVVVRAGDTVRKGQVIARLDSVAAWANTSDLDAQIRTARIELDRLSRSAPLDAARSRIGVAEAESHVARARTTLRQRMADFGVQGDADSIAHAAGGRIHVGFDGPSADLLAAEAELDAAKTQVSSSQLASFDIEHKRAELGRLEMMLTASRTHLKRQTIVAPASGVVLTDQPEQLPGLAVMAGQPFLEVADVHHWRATLAVAERDIFRVRVGDRADIEIPAFAALPNDHFGGRIVSVGWQPASASASVVAGSSASPSGYRVLVQLDSADLESVVQGDLRRGYAVHAKIVTRSERALLVFIEQFRDRARGVVR